MRKIFTFIAAASFMFAVSAQTFPLERIAYTHASGVNQNTKTPKLSANYNKSGFVIYESGGAVTPGNALWVRNLTGHSAGAYWSGTTPHGSASQANGSALFDSDFLDNNGIPGAFGTGSSPSSHKSELISPPIDLTGYTNQALIVKFFTFYRSFQISNLGVSLSVDGGVTYSNVNILNNSINFTEQIVSILFRFY